MSDLSEREVRQKFWDLARKQYPDVGEPGTVWVLTEVLGWDWDKLTRVAVEGFSRDGYRTFLLDEAGKRTVSDGDPYLVRTVYRKWTKQEKRKLKDWWWLLGY